MFQENIKRQLRKKRVRAKIFGTGARPRLSVFRSLKHLYAQLIDDEKGETLAAVNDLQIDSPLKGIARAKEIGKRITQKAIKKGIKSVVFDRGEYKYHGQIKALVEEARREGLQF